MVIVIILDLNDEVIKALQSARREGRAEDEKITTVRDMENCFGFDVRIYLLLLLLF